MKSMQKKKGDAPSNRVNPAVSIPESDNWMCLMFDNHSL